MNPKKISVLVVTIAALIVTAWRGASEWAAISSAVAAGGMGVLLLLSRSQNPRVVELVAYVQDLEDALSQKDAAKLVSLKAKHLSAVRKNS